MDNEKCKFGWWSDDSNIIYQFSCNYIVITDIHKRQKMSGIIADNLIENYYRVINNWDFESKINLISKLTLSLGKKRSNLSDFSSSFGAWNDSRDADEIIREIESARINQKELVGF